MNRNNEPISDEQLSIYRRHFDNFDIKQEGAVPTENLGTLLRACGQVPTEAWLNERLKVADPGQRGIVEWDGFVKVLNQATVAGNPDKDLLEAFRRFDKGSTGKIRCSHLREVMTSMGDILTEEEVEELIKDGDPLNMGEINYESLTRTLVYGPD